MAGNKNWTCRELLDLRAMHALGMRAPEMAVELDRSVEAVRFKCKALRLGLKKGGREGEIINDEKLVREASELLGKAINALIDRMPANDVHAVLGMPCHPRIPRAPYKTQSALRELAA